jgi:hypothetical protein
VRSSESSKISKQCLVNYEVFWDENWLTHRSALAVHGVRLHTRLAVGHPWLGGCKNLELGTPL